MSEIVEVIVSDRKTAEALAALITSEAVAEMLEKQGGTIIGVLLTEKGVQEIVTEEQIRKENPDAFHNYLAEE